MVKIYLSWVVLKVVLDANYKNEHTKYEQHAPRDDGGDFRFFTITWFGAPLYVLPSQHCQYKTCPVTTGILTIAASGNFHLRVWKIICGVIE